MNRMLFVALAAASLLSTACISPIPPWFSSAAYGSGITRFEGFREPKRVWASRADGAVAVEADAFYYTPEELSNVRSRKFRPGFPFWARFSDRPVHRRYIYASGELMEKIVAQAARNRSAYEALPDDCLSIFIYPLPLWKSEDSPSYLNYWRVIPSGFDAPDPADADLPIDRSGGFSVVSWQSSAAFETNDRGRREFYYAWKQPVAWNSRDGRTWRLSFYLQAYTAAARHERPPNALDWFKPVFWTLDVVTSPVQFVVNPFIFAFNAGPSRD